MLRITRALYFLLICLVLFLGACDSDKIITLEEAKEIALEDAQDFKPENKDFKVWETEETNRGWIILISSSEPVFEKSSPNIYYEIGENGRILDRDNLAIAE